MASDHPGHRALAALDEILRQKPKAARHLFSEAAEGMAAFRDLLIDRSERQQLERVNAIISVVLAGHFPLGPVPWAEIAAAREWLASAFFFEKKNQKTFT